tara:strand:- start:941 stop:1621 length:681 start_codon:yes stop_codon:yes gene_type:complete
MPVPIELSILLPTFHDGEESSVTGSCNFLDNFIDSLVMSLSEDPTYVELLIGKGGPNDPTACDVMDRAVGDWHNVSLYRYGKKINLSKILNRLSKIASGRVLVKCNADIEFVTPSWAEKLLNEFDNAPSNVGILGTNQIGISDASTTESCGDSEFSGCFYPVRQEVFKEIGGWNEKSESMCDFDFTLQAQNNGWKVMNAPEIEFISRKNYRKDLVDDTKSKSKTNA